jgi:hypothetical protein
MTTLKAQLEWLTAELLGLESPVAPMGPRELDVFTALEVATAFRDELQSSEEKLLLIRLAASEDPLMVVAGTLVTAAVTVLHHELPYTEPDQDAKCSAVALMSFAASALEMRGAGGAETEAPVEDEVPAGP